MYYAVLSCIGDNAVNLGLYVVIGRPTHCVFFEDKTGSAIPCKRVRSGDKGIDVGSEYSVEWGRT